MKRKMKKLTREEMDLLKKRFGPVEFTNTFNIVYQDHFPNTGLVLLEGEALLMRNNKVVQVIEPGTMLGIHQLIGNQVVKEGCRICGNSKVILLKRSEIMELVEEGISGLILA